MMKNRWLLAAIAFAVVASGCEESSSNGNGGAECDALTFSPFCLNATQSAVCLNGRVTAQQCLGDCNILAGVCNGTVQESCITGISYPYCENGNRVSCENGLVTRTLCAANEVCINGLCRLPGTCLSALDCSNGYVCNAGLCEPPKTSDCRVNGCTSGTCNVLNGLCEVTPNKCDAVICPAGYSCNPVSGGCTPDNEDCTVQGCVSGYECDLSTKKCVPGTENCVEDGCDYGYLCNEMTGKCEQVPPEDKTCRELGCGVGQVCNEMTGICEPEELSCIETGCDDDEVCDETTGRCVSKTPSAQSCVETGCNDGFICNETTGKCVKEPDCKADTDCNNGYVCNSGTCVLSDPNVIQCETLSISGTNTCEKTGTGSTIVLKGDVLALDKTYKGGMVVVSGGKIQYVGCAQNNTVDISKATVITCPDSVISPSFINGHDHITYSNSKPGSWGNERFDHRHDWRTGANGHKKVPGPGTSDNMVTEVRALMAGTTSIFGSVGNNGPDFAGLVRNLDNDSINSITSVYDTFPLSDSKGALATSGCSSYSLSSKAKKFNDSCPYGPHIAEGINQEALNEIRCLSSASTGIKDLFKSKMAVIHGIAATPDYIAQMAENGTKLIWSPRTNISLYGDTARVTMFDRMGVTIGLGTDWIYSGSANMLREMACIDNLNRNYFSSYFSDYQLWKMPTFNNALAFGLEKTLGQLKEGYLADIAVFKTTKTKQLYRAVIDASSEDVLLVMINGKLAYGDANLMDKGDAVDVCGVAKKIDMTANGAVASGVTFASVQKKAAYDLYFCSGVTPKNEPSCTPQRTRVEDTTNQNTTLYDGDFSDTNDADGDGIPDADDNCPYIFNPIRPQDTDRKQADYDGDGLGDVCDPYPTCKSNDEACAAINPRDKDGDGYDNDVDNCPDAANADQKDTDKDGIGDVCDKCPNEAGLSELNGCPLTTMELKDIRSQFVSGTLATGSTVLTEGIVTAIAVKPTSPTTLVGFFIQDDVDPAGAYVYDATAVKNVAVGDKIRIQAKTDNYYDMLEFVSPTVTKIGTAAVPAPIPLTAEQSTNTKNPYDSVLVKVSGLKAGSISDKAVWSCTDSVGKPAYVDDFIMGTTAMTTAMTAGKTYDVTGVLVYDFSQSKVAPRSTGDIVLSSGGTDPGAPVSVSSLTPSVLNMKPGDKKSVTVTLSKISTQEETVKLSSDAAFITFPASVTVPANSVSTSFDVDVASTAVAGSSAVIEAKVGDTAAQKLTVNVQSESSGDLNTYTVNFKDATKSNVTAGSNNYTSYDSVYKVNFSSSIVMTAVGNFEMSGYSDSLVLTGNTKKNAKIEVTGISGLGSVTIDWRAYSPKCGTMGCAINIQAGGTTKKIEFVANETELSTVPFDDDSVTSFTVSTNGSAASNDANRLAVNSISWTTSN